MHRKQSILSSSNIMMQNFNDLAVLRNVLIEVSNGIVITTTEGEIIWVNKAFEKTTGYTFKDVLGKNPRILKSGKHPKDFYKNIWETLKKGETWNGELTNRRKDGTLYIDLQTITPIKSNDGSITNFVAIKQDVTQYRLMEREMEENLAMLHAIFNYSIDAILFTIPDGNIVRANHAACKMFQMDEQELTSVGAKGILDFSDPNLMPALELRARTGRFTGQLTFIRKDGSRFTGEIYSNIFPFGEGLRTSMIIREVRELK
jgi:two-component system, NtrC family, sensor kinase